MAERWASFAAAARMAVASKSLWRNTLVVIVFALIFIIFTSARHLLDAHNSLTFVSPLQPSELPPTPVATDDTHVDWSQYAYCQYATNLDYLCNSVMIFESLMRVAAKAERLLLYPQGWNADMETPQGRLLVRAREDFGAKLAPIQVAHLDGERTWAESFTKLLAFNQTQYKRVLSLDSDSTVMQAMDELFLLPSAPVAMPRAYWLNKDKDKKTTFSSQLVLVEPSEVEFARIEHAFSNRRLSEFDMEIVNDLYGQQCLVIPHRRYDMLTGEFRGKNHANYLGSDHDVWTAAGALAEAKFIHFSDWPVPKPWKLIPEDTLEEKQPNCRETVDGAQDCSDREAWLGLYEDFRKRRARVC